MILAEYSGSGRPASKLPPNKKLKVGVKQCGAICRRFECTRVKGHPGNHVAHASNGNALLEWNDTK